MSDVPRITGSEAIRAFERAGFHVCRITKHHIMKKDGCPNRLSIPVHGQKILGLGLLKSQIVAAELTIDEFNEFLN